MIREIYRIMDALPEEFVDMDSEEYTKAKEQAEVLKCEIYKKLPPELREGFTEFVDVQEIAAVQGMEDSFMKGFHFLARLIMDMYLTV